MSDAYTLDDFAQLNPMGPGQKRSHLDTLLEFASTSEEQLADFSNLLDSKSGPFIVAFGQLPFDLGLGAANINAPGASSGLTLDLHVRPLNVSLDAMCRLNRSENEGIAEVVITQLAGVIRLRGIRESIYSVYESRLQNFHNLKDQLGNYMVENWMTLPEAKLAEPVRRKRALTGLDFEKDVAIWARAQLHYATKELLKAYSVSALVNMQGRDFLYGYHTMVSAGRLSMAGNSVPVIKGLFNSANLKVAERVTLASLHNSVQNQARAIDPLITRLQALNIMALNGEYKLALMGCGIALEWFVNITFPSLQRTKKDGSIRSASLNDFLSSKYSSALPNEIKHELRLLVEQRNGIAHASDSGLVDLTTVKNALDLSLKTYKIINVALEASNT